MHRWRVGDAEIVRVEDSSFALPSGHDVPAWMVPGFAPSDAGIGIAFSAVGIAVERVGGPVRVWRVSGPTNRRGRVRARGHGGRSRR